MVVTCKAHGDSRFERTTIFELPAIDGADGKGDCLFIHWWRTHGVEPVSLGLDPLPWRQYYWHVVVLENELPTLANDEHCIHHL